MDSLVTWWIKIMEKSIPGRGESHELPTVTTVITEITIFPLL